MSKKFLKLSCSVIAFMSLFVGCQKEVSDDIAAGERVSLKISVPDVETKLISGFDDQVANNYQIFLFNEDGIIEDYVSQDSPSAEFDCTIGKKKIVVFVNAPDYSDVMDCDVLFQEVSLLEDNSPTSFVMSGYTTIELKTNEKRNVNVNVIRKVAKVELSGLEVDIDIPQYSEKTFKILSVYLINVSAQMPYFETTAPTLWYNKLGYDSENSNELIYDDMGGVVVSSESPYTAKNTFYCYPNNTEKDTFDTIWSPRRTRLVVEAMLGDKTYYYPVTLPTIAQNKIYKVFLTITRPGSESPDSVVDKFTIGCNVAIWDWETGGTVIEEI